MDNKSRKSAQQADTASVNTSAMKRRRYTLTIIAIIAILAVFAAFTFAWFTGMVQNKNNKISAGNIELKLLTTTPTKTISTYTGRDDTNVAMAPVVSAGDTVQKALYDVDANEYFQPTSEKRTVADLDDKSDVITKFLETVVNTDTGATSTDITNEMPNFRQQRPIIVYNASDSATVNYTVDFVTREVEKQIEDKQAGLSTAYFFNYTPLKIQSFVKGDAKYPNAEDAYDLPETVLENVKSYNSAAAYDGTLTLESGIRVNNLANSIAMIDESTQEVGAGGTENMGISIPPHSCHVYMVDMGISYTAGNSYQNSDLSIDIVLSSSQKGDIVHNVNTEAELKQAIADIASNTDKVGHSGDTIVMLSDIEVKSDITPYSAISSTTMSAVYNLYPNGHTLKFSDGGLLQIQFPSAVESPEVTAVTMDIGSDMAGTILGADHIQISGSADRDCVVNWFSDIAKKSDGTSITNPAGTEIAGGLVPTNGTMSGNIILSAPANGVVVNTRTVLEYNVARYADYNNLISETVNYESGDGTASATPYVIKTDAQFAKFVAEEIKNAAQPTPAEVYYRVEGEIGEIKNLPDMSAIKAHVQLAPNAVVRDLDIQKKAVAPTVLFTQDKVGTSGNLTGVAFYNDTAIITDNSVNNAFLHLTSGNGTESGFVTAVTP